MLAPRLPANETDRIATLRSLSILDTLPEERFDRITRLAKHLFDVPIALVSLVDTERQWFKSSQGLDATETSREISFCGHTIHSDVILIVEDTHTDTRFHDNPLVTGNPNIRFYAGCPLIMSNGCAVGTLCIIDEQPRQMNETELQLLKDLGDMVIQELDSMRLATIDRLTGICNRRGFETLAPYALDICCRLGKPATLLYFDLDGFKSINDLHGHGEGDFALKTFGDLLLNTFRRADVIARPGGDEFVALLANAGNNNLDGLLQRLQAATDECNEHLDKPYRIEYSIGVSESPCFSAPDVERLVADADRQMLAEKLRKRTEAACDTGT